VAKLFVGILMRQNTVFSTKNTKNFLGRGTETAPPPRGASTPLDLDLDKS